MTTIITSLLVGAAIGEVARWFWTRGGKVQAVGLSVMWLAIYVFIMI